MTEGVRARVNIWVAVTLLCIAALVFEAAADVLPDTAYFRIITWQRVATGVGLIAVIAAGARWRDFRTRIDVPILVLVLAALLVTARVGGGAQLRHFLSFVAIFYLVTALIRIEKRAVRALVMLASTAVTVAAAVALSQYSQDRPTGFCRTGLLRDQSCNVPGALSRAIGTFENPNLLAAFLLLFAPLGVLAAASVKDRLYRVCALGLTAMAYLALAVTFSRAAYIAAVLGILVLVWQLAQRRIDAARLRVVGWIGLGALGVALGAIGAMSQAGRSLGVRTEAWGAAVSIARENPLGIGLGQTGTAINARIDSPVNFVHAHNLWLSWLAEAGVLAFLAMIAITVGALITAAWLARRGRAVGVAGLAALVGFLTMNLMDHPSNLSRIAIGFWFVLGIVMASAPARWRTRPRKAKTEEASAPAEQPQQPADEPPKRTKRKASAKSSISGELPLDELTEAQRKDAQAVEAPTERIAARRHDG